MPSKLKKAIAAVKDQTSISLAKVGGAEAASLEVAILKATTHDEVPVDERHVTEVLQHVSSNRSYAGSCARALGRRIGRTRSWVVAMKSLMLVLRIFQDGDPHFPKEVLHAMKRGYKILNLSSFRDDSSTSCPWDFTAFVRTFALYLDERLDCFLTGKLQRRKSYHQGGGTSRGYSGRKNEPIVRDMKPAMLLDRISHWQRLLDRAIATRPTGAAKSNRLVQTCLYAIVQETFDLYRDISDGLALLLDSFFHLQYNNCVNAFQTCVKASKQFEELCSFYELCKTVGVGRTSEYPSVQKVSDELVDTLQEFLKDQSSFPAAGTNGRAAPLPAPLSPSKEESDSGSVRQSEFGGSQCTSLEDLIGADAGFSPERYSDPGGEKPPSMQMEEFYNAYDTASVRSDPTDNRGVNSVMDLLCLDDPSPPPEIHGQGIEQGFEPNNEDSSSSTKPGWELALFETNHNDSNQNQDHSTNTNSFEADFFSSMYTTNTDTNASANANVVGTSSPWLSPEHNYNPFLQDTNQPEDDLFGSFPQNTGFSSGGFPGDLGLGVANSSPPTFQADFDNGSFTPNFTTDLGNNTVRKDGDISDLFADLAISSTHSHTNSVGAMPPTFFSNASANNVSGPPLDHANFGSEFGDGSANAMNAIVPFGSNDDGLFSSGPTFGATPTFRATSLDMDQCSLGSEIDPFGSLDVAATGHQRVNTGSLDQQSLLLQQQLWLQNQNKIMARHLT